jgi:hypothetical protein
MRRIELPYLIPQISVLTIELHSPYGGRQGARTLKAFTPVCFQDKFLTIRLSSIFWYSQPESNRHEMLSRQDLNLLGIPVPPYELT